jgi:hypothetical protein
MVFALGLLVGRNHGTPVAATEGPAAEATPVAAPDISNLSPRERFDRLFAKVMQASSSGDAATMQQFTPMAIAAYGMLDSTDIDAQYDVAILKLHSGDIAGARLLADSMVRARPTHLFGQMIRYTAARFSGDSAAARTAQAAFLRNYPEEIRRARPEYAKHQSSLDAFKQQIERAP